MSWDLTPYEYCTCPEGTQVQTYSNSYSVEKPFGRRNLVNIDKCIYDEILCLWGLGIETTGCCCGHHGKASAFIGVIDEHIPKMKELGYRVQHNPCRPKDEDQFYLLAKQKN